MKKLVTLVLAIVLIMALSVTSMALVSPGGTVYREIFINRTNTGSNSYRAERIIIIDGETHKLVPVKSKDGTFLGWNIYEEDMDFAVMGKDYEIESVTLLDGKKAVKGKDYTLVDGRVIAKNGTYLVIEIKPIADTLYISENFKGVKIKFNIDDSKVLSPKTGEEFDYSVIASLSLVILAAGAIAVCTKRTLLSK